MESNVSENLTRPFHCFPNWLRYLGLICSIFLLLLCLIGIIGNSLSIAIFLKPRFRRLSINIFLSALSITDLCQQFLAVPVFGSGPLLSFWCRWKFIQFVFSFSTVYLYPALMTFHFCSIWILIAISFERWIAVCKPLLSITYCTRKRAVITVMLIVMFSVSYNMIRFWEFDLTDSYRAITSLRKDSDYMLWYGVIGYLFMMYLTPLIAMANFNIRMILELRRSFARRKAMSKRQNENRKTAHMLLWLVCSFAFCYTPSYILNVIEALYPRFFWTHFGFALCDVNNVLAALNGATTFLFYLKFSSQYRTAARSILRHILRQSYSLSQPELQRVDMLMNDSPSITTSRYTATRIFSNHKRAARFALRAVSVDHCSCSPKRPLKYCRSRSTDESGTHNEFIVEGFRERQMAIDSNCNSQLVHMKRRTVSTVSLSTLLTTSKMKLLNSKFDYYDAVVCV